MRKPRHRGAASSPGWVAGLGSDPPACPQTPAPDHSPLRPLPSSTQQTGWVSPASASVPPGLIDQHHPCAPFLPHDTSIPYTWEHSCSSSSLSLSQVLRGYLTFLGLLYFSTQSDGMGREEGGGFGMGNTCIPVADSFWYLAKLIQLCKV